MPNVSASRRTCSLALLIAGMLLTVLISQPLPADEAIKPEWTSQCRFRVLLTVDPRGRARSNSPASAEVDFQSLLTGHGTFDEHTLEVVAYDDLGQPRIFDKSRPESERRRVPHRLDRLFGSTRTTLSFVVPDQHCTRLAAYFDTVDSGRGQPLRFHGIVGDGDRFREIRQRREIAASHFDQFVDFDGDGDLDLFQGGVEPYVYCHENVGSHRLVDRGRLASGGRLFTLPASKENRSWLTVALYDVDDDGDQDFLPSFQDGPDAGRFLFYRNATQRGGALTFTRVGPLMTVAGVPLAGGAQAGGWFPSIALLKDWDGEPSGRLDAIVGSNHRCWLYRGAGLNAGGTPQFAEAVALHAAGADINLVNPRFYAADIDSDGDLDLFAGTQPGPVHWFENIGTRAKPTLAAGRVVALDGKYLIGDAHSGLAIADFGGDGLLDLLAGRYWQRTDLNYPTGQRDFGSLYRNTGPRGAPQFVRVTDGVPFTEQFQICDAVRQNCVRAADWDGDGKSDLLAGDTDGFVWLFRNQSSQFWPLFARGERLLAGGRPLSVAGSGGHARLDVCDWNGDGLRGLIVADGHGTLTLFRGLPGKSQPELAAGEPMTVAGKPVQGSARASVLVCDWDSDGKHDVVFADQQGYTWHRNLGSAKEPLLAGAQAITFAGQSVKYVRPNLGSLVDWDGDGQRDLIGCHFENSIRLYRNIAPRGRSAEPQFADAEGVTILQGDSPQMISGADAIDWNGDGDLDLLTGQGHGGSGLRLYERDWIEDELRGTHPNVQVGALQSRPER
jgi:hypothetical protein